MIHRGVSSVAGCSWCRQPQRWHTAKQGDACLRAHGIFRNRLGCRSGLPSLLDERRRIFAETEMLVTLARDLLIRREPEATVVHVIKALLRTDPAGLSGESVTALAESTVEIASMRQRHLLNPMDWLNDDEDST